ncbi:MAG: efflux RND transporter permease subunit [bacterium]|nr:efflux RND transporter permease subunit [bacterium]
MIRFFHFFASRHLLANLLTGMFLLAGVGTLFTINRDLFPRVELDQVVIRTLFPGASAEDVELNVTNKIEAELVGITGVDRVYSTSAEDVSVITVLLDNNLSRANIDATIQDIREATGRARNLPRDLPAPPIVSRLRASEIPILEVGFEAPELSYSELRERVRVIEKKMREIRGVAKIEMFGFRAREVRIEVSPDALKRYDIPLTEIARMVQARNIRGTAGTLESYTSERNLVTTAQFEHPLEVGEVIVRGNFAGYGVRVKDMATIKDDYEREIVRPRMNGREMIVFSVSKKESADIIRTVERIKEFARVEQERDSRLFRGLSVAYSNDLSRYVRASFGVVATNGALGFLLVVIVLTVFLNFRTSLWVAIGIPVSLLGTIAVMPIFGVYLDVVTLTAMILVLGIIVDDAIIVSETVYREWQKGLSPVDAAAEGVRRVWLPVLTTIATTILAFLPMFFIPGEIGKFIIVIPIVITIALLISLFEGLIALPAHVAQALTKTEQRAAAEKNISGTAANAGAGAVDERGNWFGPFRDRFEVWLENMLRYRLSLIGGFTAFLTATLVYAVAAMPIEIFPSDGAEHFTVFVETPVGTSLEGTAAAVSRVEALIDELPKSEIDSYFTLIGTHGGFLTQDHLAVIYVNLTPYSGRDRRAEEIVEALRPVAERVEGLERITLDVKDSGPSPEKSVSLRIIGTEDEPRERLAEDIASYLSSIDGITDVDSGIKRGKRQVQLRLDYPALARLGLSAAEIARTVRIAYDGEEVTRVQYGEDEIEFRLTMPASAKTDLATLGELLVPNALGNLVPLKHVASFKDTPETSAYIPHFNGERSVNVQANTDKEILKPEAVPAMVLKEFDLAKYPGTRIRIEGAAKTQDDNIGHALRTFVMAVAGIYCLLVLLFNSFRQPFYVMTAVPFGISGVIVTFAIHSFPLSFMAMLGIISLSGVVVNDSLVLVDHVNGLRREHPDTPLRAVVARAAADRLRAILMTTVTTVAGLLPLAYGVGGEDPANAPMALALGWGLLFATGLVLVLVPALYLTGEEWKARSEERRRIRLEAPGRLARLIANIRGRFARS